MNAIDMLEEQHREVDDLFEELSDAKGQRKEDLFAEIADKLAVHAAIEERNFYPAVRERRTEDIVLESMEEHLQIKRVLVDLMSTDIQDRAFDARVKVLKEEVEHHVEEEESELFPKVRRLMTDDELEALGQEMTATQEELLEQGNPREHVPEEATSHPAI